MAKHTLTAFAACALLASACGTEKVVTVHDTVTAGGGASSAASSSAGPSVARLGDAITLQGSTDGSKLKVTLLKIVDRAPYQQYLGPEPGQKFVVVKVKLENVGAEVFDDSPSNGAVLIDTADQGYQATFEAVQAAPLLESVRIAPGSTRAGWLVFVAPKATKWQTFQFTLDSGFGPEAGEWTL